MACPSTIVPKGWWPHGLSHQEASQADGEEEAPQAAEEDADPAQEQEVVGGYCGSRGCASGVPAVSAPRDGALSGGQALASARDPVARDRMTRIVGDTLAAVASLADNGRRGSPVPRSERI